MKQRLCKRNILSAVIVSLSAALTLLFFAPSDAMLHNADEFPVGAEHIVFPMLLLSLAVAAGAFLVLLICMLINQKLFDSILCLFFGLGCAAYVQMLFFNSHMVIAIEDTSVYAERNFRNYLNFFLYYLIFFLPLILYFAKLSYKSKFYSIITRKNLSIAAAIIIAMQTVGTCSALPNVHKVEEYQYTEYLSYEPLTSLSKEKNIIVFIPDTLDARFMKETEEKYPDIYDKFDGFTFYSNNAASYSQTFPAIANLLTGCEYNGESNYGYLKTAWGGSSAIDKLRENGFVSDLVLETYTSFSNIAFLRGHCDNIRSADCGYSINYFKDNGILRMMTLMAFSKTLPYFMKPLATESISPDFNAFFVELENEPDDKMRYDTNYYSDKRFLDYIRAHELDADNDSKVFGCVHLVGAHDYQTEIAALYDGYDGAGLGECDCIRGDFEVIFEYLEQMKKIGVYDNSTIIILGDHGIHTASMLNGGTISEAITTALLIKPENAHGRLQDNDTAEMSHAYFQASLLDYAGLDHSGCGYSYNDIVEGDISAPRSLSLQAAADTEYVINGDASDFGNWVCVKANSKALEASQNTYMEESS